MIVRTHTLLCDTCGKWSSSTGHETAQLARSHAQRMGWTRVDGKDLCAKHGDAAPASEIMVA